MKKPRDPSFTRFVTTLACLLQLQRSTKNRPGLMVFSADADYIQIGT